MAKKNKNNKATCELNQQTLDYLGLSKQPFASEILTEKSFFNNQALSKISDSLMHQVQFSDLLLIIEGSHGSGKTSLFRQFIQTEITNVKVLSMQAEATDTLVQIQQKMSIHLQDLGDANHLDDNLKSLQMFDQTPLVVMDNSHVLSDTTLQEFFRYQQQLKQEHEVTVKILLFANTGMTETLQKITDIQNDQMYVQNMPEFSPKQLDNFIMHRLRSAGYSGEPLLDNSSIQLLFKNCNGTPLDIMMMAAPLIDKAITNKIKPATPGWVKTLIAFIVLCVLVLGAYIVYVYFTENSLQTNQNTETPVANNTSSMESTNTSTDLNEADSIIETDVIETLENDDITITTDTLAETNDVIEPTSIEPAVETVIKTEPIKVAELEVEPEPEPVPEIKIAPTPAPEPVHVPVHIPVPVPAVETVKEEPEPVVKTVSPINPVLQQLEKMGLRDAQWLSQQNSQNWTLQLLGARAPETLLKFSRRNKLSSNTVWYKTWLKGKPYYVIVYGNYPDRNTARNAIAGLPPELRKLKPWVKSMKSVQKALK